MNDPNEPSTEDFEALLDGLLPGDPLADEVEDLLDTHPVFAHERDVDAAVSALSARLAPQSRPSRRSGPLAIAAVAVALLLVAGLSWKAGNRAAAPAEVVPVATVAIDPTVGETEVLLRDGSIAEVRDDTVLLLDGVVSISRTDPRQQGAHRVRLTGMDLSVEPIGTEYFVAAHGDEAAIWVREGRVRLMHESEGHLGEVTAGSWALVTTEGSALQLHRVPDGPFDPTDIGLDPSAAQLLADIRWMALPSKTRSAILNADGP